MYEPSMENHVVLIFGGAGGFCRILASRFIHLGAVVFVMGNNIEFTVNSCHEMALCYPKGKVFPIVGVDGRDLDSVNKAYNFVVQKCGRLDVVISGVAGAYLQDFRHISSDHIEVVQSIDELGFQNLANSILHSNYQFQGRFIRIHPQLHNYGIQFYGNWRNLGIAPGNMSCELVSEGSMSQLLRQVFGPYDVNDNKPNL